MSQNTPFLGLGNSVSRDGSMPPPSRASDSGFSTKSLSFGHGHAPYGSIGGHTPNSSIHSQRPSISGPSGSYQSHANSSRYIDHESDLRDGFGRMKLDADNESPGMGSQLQQISLYQTQNSAPQPYQLNGAASMWDNYPNGQKDSVRQDNYQPFQDQYFKPPPQFGDRGSVSPAGSDYRRGPNSPNFYPVAGPPTSGSDQGYRPGSRGPRAQQGPSELERRLQTNYFAQQFYAMYGQLPNQYPPHMYDYSVQNYRPSNVPYGYQMPMPPYGNQLIPTRPAKDQDIGAGIRSALLEDFRSNGKTNKRYELKDLYEHIVEFSGDQHGSRFIQGKLETANSDEKEQIFREIQPNAVQLMTDVFGNYVIQKMFEHGNQIQKKVLAEQMRHHVMDLSLQMYGCRVVQKVLSPQFKCRFHMLTTQALEHVLADQQVELVSELQADVLRCVKDQNGNHVVQKAIERVPTEHLQFVIEAFRGQVNVLATHPYGCRVIQRILEHCKPKDQVAILEELHVCSEMLITDQFGNYVTQHVIQHGNPEDRAKVIKIVTARLLDLSKHKFASNVVEKSIQFGTDEQRQAIVDQLTTIDGNGTSPLQLMMKDQYGNYVIRKYSPVRLLHMLTITQRNSLHNSKVLNATPSSTV
jgi:mRNA-binding protein PUF3